jgi:transcriptional regulator with XRE-family HTH domain
MLKMNELGKRIKKLRLEKGMTLVELANNKMSKGMLSMIENGHSNPSMDSLKYIASQLGCDPQYLLGSPTSDDLKYLFVKIENAFEINDDKQINKLTQDLLDKQLPITFESARILELSGRTIIKTNQKQGEMLIERAVMAYERLSLYNNCMAAKLHIIECRAKMGNYHDALIILRNVKKEYWDKKTVTDLIVETEVNYVEMILLFGIGDYTSGRDKLNQLIELFKKKMIFYKMENIFRIAAFQAFLHDNDNDFAYFIKKSEQFAVFSENDTSLAFTLLLQSHYHNEKSKNYEQALFYLNKYATLTKGELGSDYYYLEKGKALLGENLVKEALEEFEKFEMPSTINYPLELCILYTAHAYRAYCLLQLGRVEEASIYAEKAANKLDSLPDTPYKLFIKNTLELVNKKL